MLGSIRLPVIMPTSVAAIILNFKPTFSAVFSTATKQHNTMRNFKNLLPLIAIILGLGLVFSQSAFKSGVKQSKTEVMFQYQDADDSRIDDGDAWTEVTELTVQECTEGITLPCVVKFDTGDYADIDAYLLAHPTAQDILDDEESLQSKKLV
jgi:hypothetical protein